MKKMDWTTIKMSELMRQKTRRMDAPYWIRLHSHNVLEKIRKKREAASHKLQAASAMKQTQLKGRIKT
jgi:hypothetical protein